MKLIAVVDDRNGMMFNKRRQSRDRILCEKIISLTKGGKLWMHHYSASLFKDYSDPAHIIIDDDFLQKAGRGEFCFVENVLPDERKIEEIILFQWNRKYPGDYYFDIDLSSWKLDRTEDFAGSSHKNITMEVYTHER